MSSHTTVCPSWRAFAGAALFLALASSVRAQEAAPVAAVEPKSWVDAIQDGRFWLSARLRYEHVEQDGFTKDAEAVTLRTVLGMETAKWNGFSGVLEFEDVSSVGDERFNSTTNGKTNFPVVADPNGSEINQAFLRYSGDERWSTSLGRQRIVLDNQRFVGNIGWRQNEQTFDAASASARLPAEIDLFVAYLDNVNRVFGDGSPLGNYRMDSWLLNASRELGVAGKLVVYAYLLDNTSDPLFSSNTYGARLAGKHKPDSGVGFQWTGEYAAQSDTADNPNDLDQDYTLLEVGATVSEFTLLLGHETLGGSGGPGDAFQTSLATAHLFNGLADKFLVTPPDGLRDTYVTLGTRVRKVDASLAWHGFEADTGGADYGTEVDATLVFPFSKACVIGAAFADYQADDYATDTTKWWLWVGGSI